MFLQTAPRCSSLVVCWLSCSPRLQRGADLVRQPSGQARLHGLQLSDYSAPHSPTTAPGASPQQPLLTALNDWSRRHPQQAAGSDSAAAAAAARPQLHATQNRHPLCASAAGVMQHGHHRCCCRQAAACLEAVCSSSCLIDAADVAEVGPALPSRSSSSSCCCSHPRPEQLVSAHYMG